MNIDYITRRESGAYCFRMVVPPPLRGKFGKREVWKSLKTNDRKQALIKAAPLIQFWSNLFSSGEAPQEEVITFDQVSGTAAKLGFEYRSAQDILAATIQDSVEMLKERLQAAQPIRRRNRAEIASLAGVMGVPGMTMNQALKRYEELSPDKFMNYSDERERYKRWRPFVQAAKSFTEVMGDVDILTLKPKDCFKYKAALVQQVADGKLKVDSARKKIMWLRLIHTKVLEIDAPDLLPCPWDRITIEGDGSEKGKRKPFTEEEIKLVREKLDNSDASKQLIALNLISMNTGATCKELTHLHKDDIVLDAPIPYIAIRPNANRNRVKGNGTRIREIPLIGRALEEMKKFPDGFDEFCRNNGSEDLSRLSNDIIKGVVKDRTFYSYRHRIADVLRRSGCQDTLKNSIMGHTSEGMQMHYGAGYTLENKLEALLKALPEDNR